MKKILVIDNHDSFIYNLIEYIRLKGDCTMTIIYNEEISTINVMDYDGILLSPGAGLPIDYPEMYRLLAQCYDKKPILGVCLGHQAIATHFGAQLHRLSHPKHGHTSYLHILDPTDILWQGVEKDTPIGRYHSWVIDSHRIPDILRVTAVDEIGNIMAIKHCDYPIWGVQFHPESIITENGHRMINNWLDVL